MLEVQQSGSRTALDVAAVRAVQNATDCSLSHEAASIATKTASNIQVQLVAACDNPFMTTNVHCIQCMCRAYLMCCQTFILKAARYLASACAFCAQSGCQSLHCSCLGQFAPRACCAPQ